MREKTNIEKDDSSSKRVIRGGSWNYLAGYVVVAVRYAPSNRSHDVGFRLVLQTKEKK